MQRLLAIIGLTWKAAFRYRLFWVIVTLLLGAVVGLPLLIKHDGTADGFAQILITYTLGAVTALLGLCTLWLACGTLARDIEECQLQLVLVKPIARWQVWLGKWLGLVSLNAVLLAVAGGSVYGLIEWRARGLSDEELFKLRNQVLVARASAKPASMDQAIEAETRKRLEDLIAKKGLGTASPDAVANSIRDKLKAEVQVVGPDQTGIPWQ
ncbi:MAG TPA: ABC transporter permease subunit, partial [Verrucomicrobiae bacterium]|nr:ABC transporter permease subunit [Verrucomicrobiae bacterium]